MIRVAVRPERIRIDPVDAPAPEEGSRLDGRIAEIVYLGMFTQFHVETPPAALLCHRMADEDLAGYAVGTPVVLTWPSRSDCRSRG